MQLKKNTHTQIGEEEEERSKTEEEGKEEEAEREYVREGHMVCEPKAKNIVFLYLYIHTLP